MLNDELVNQHQLSQGLLLDENGNLNEAGFALSLVRDYNRGQIKGLKSRIKEWDYYYIGNSHFGVALTIADNSYMALASVSFLNFDTNEQVTKSKMKFFTFGKLKLPSSSKEGVTKINWKGLEMSFVNENNQRKLNVLYKNFSNHKDFRLEVVLSEFNQDSLVISTPFKKEKHFYYNQKINNLSANGYCKFNDQFYYFDETSQGVLDWGRGIWTYDNTWYWASMNGEYQGKKIGMNLGYGFGDTSVASENIFYIDGMSYKLNDVRFDISTLPNGKHEYLKQWKFRSKTGDISLIFDPVLHRKANMNLLFLKSDQNQIFGLFSGYIIVNGKQEYFENIPGFAEKVHNLW